MIRITYRQLEARQLARFAFVPLQKKKKQGRRRKGVVGGYSAWPRVVILATASHRQAWSPRCQNDNFFGGGSKMVVLMDLLIPPRSSILKLSISLEVFDIQRGDDGAG